MKDHPLGSLFQDKGEFTKFQILHEIRCNQPNVKQKDVSKRIGITIQAISKHLKQLVKDGLIETGSQRASYHLTQNGVVKLRDDLEKIDEYVKTIKNELKFGHALIAIASRSVKAGQQVGLITKGGVFYTVPTTDCNVEVIGIAANDAKPGEDLGLKDLQGKIKFKQGKILIIKLPSIHIGGSRAADLVKIQELINEFKPDRIGAMGAIGRVIINKLDLKADIEFDICRSAVIAASRGLNVLVLVVGHMVNKIIQEVNTQDTHFALNILYEVKDAKII
jgi:putative transcriptional regulator